MTRYEDYLIIKSQLTPRRHYLVGVCLGRKSRRFGGFFIYRFFIGIVALIHRRSWFQSSMDGIKFEGWPLGIVVDSDKNVFYSKNNHELLDTRIEVNPKSWIRKGYKHHSIFNRKKNDAHSDANPFIHALKGNSGYRISKEEVLKFFPEFDCITRSVCNTVDFQFLIPLPSSHCANRFLARYLCSGKLGSLVRTGLLRKKMVGEVHQDLEGIINSGLVANANHAREIKKQLSQLSKMPQGSVFSMKKISNHRVRTKINPLCINDISSCDLNNKRVLLVDDVYASGATINGAIAAIEGEFRPSVIESLCLLGRLR